jgi:hypothetical protein
MHWNFITKKLKVLWHAALLFVLIFSSTYIHSITLIQYLYSSVATRQGSSPSPHRWSDFWEKPPWGAELGIELGSTLQHADVLPSKLCRALP